MEAVAASDGLTWTRRASRMSALAALVCIGLVLALARLLHPDPRGHGTHEHLYLPPCLFLKLTHLPCPFCGMTTGFAHMARGEFLAAAVSNPGAPLLFAITCLCVLLSVRALVMGMPVLPAWATSARANRFMLLFIGVMWVLHLGYLILGVPPG